MMKFIGCFCLTLLLSISLFAQMRVIADMDIDSDVDDVAALAMLNNLHKSRNIKLLGVIVTSDDPYAAVCNRFFNNSGFPIGLLKNQHQDSKQSYVAFRREVNVEKLAKTMVDMVLK